MVETQYTRKPLSKAVRTRGLRALAACRRGEVVANDRALALVKLLLVEPVKLEEARRDGYIALIESDICGLTIWPAGTFESAPGPAPAS